VSRVPNKSRCDRGAHTRASSDTWKNPFAKRHGALATVAALCAAALGVAAAVLPWRSIAPIARPDASVFSAATIARGQQLPPCDCAVCHTVATAAPSMPAAEPSRPVRHDLRTNITPIPRLASALVLSAFERAMRQGIHRDGRHLYPAFPIRISRKTTDADLQAL